MKYLSLIGILLILFACSNEENKDTKKKNIQPESLIEIKDGIYTEYYPGKKKVRIQGNVGINNIREGKWTFYTEDGKEMSTCLYENGKKEGHSVVKRPNGSLNFVGEYHNDQKVGVWEFYDDKGNSIKTIDYGQPKE